MHIEPVFIFNLFMIACACWSCFWWGRAYEIGAQSREKRAQVLEKMITEYQVRSVR